MSAPGTPPPPRAHPLPVSTEKEGLVHSLSLRVMMLKKPSFGVFQPVGCEQGDLPAGLRFSSASYNRNELVSKNSERTTPVMGVDTLGVSEYLEIPTNRNELFVGETFTCYICCTNDGEFPVTNIIFKLTRNLRLQAELQTGNRRYPLIDNSKTPFPEIKPGKSCDYVIRHKLTEATGHVFVCSVGYTTHTHEQLHLRKFFRLLVSNPLGINTSVEPIINGYLVATQLTNQTASELFLESVDFVPNKGFVVEDLNDSGKKLPSTVPLSDTELTTLPLFPPQSVSQYLFRVTYSNLDTPDLRERSLGHLTITWRSQMGAKGEIQTEPISHITKYKRQLLLMVTEIPNRVTLKKPFILPLKIINLGERIVTPRLTVVKSKSSGLAVSGITGNTIQDIEPMGSVLVDLTVLPLETGMQTLSGLRIQDVVTDKVYDFNNVITVMVESPL